MTLIAITSADISAFANVVSVERSRSGNADASWSCRKRQGRYCPEMRSVYHDRPLGVPMHTVSAERTSLRAPLWR
jgi:hypothetical protein